MINESHLEICKIVSYPESLKVRLTALKYIVLQLCLFFIFFPENIYINTYYMQVLLSEVQRQRVL